MGGHQRRSQPDRAVPAGQVHGVGGRQYWRITGDYFKGRQSIVTWIWVGVLLLSTIISVRLDVLLSYYSNDLYTSLQVAFQGGRRRQ